MNNIKVFNHEQFGEVRVINEGGQVWFDGNQVAKMLGYVKERNAISRHCKGALKHSTLKNKGGHPLTIIPEPDLYRLVAGSQLESAAKFEEWIFEEVLPSIRKHGAYMTPDKIEEVLLNPDTLIQLATNLKKEQEKRRQLEAENEEMKPKALFAAAVETSTNSILIGQLAKLIKQNGHDIGQNRLFSWLRDKGIYSDIMVK